MTDWKDLRERAGRALKALRSDAPNPQEVALAPPLSKGAEKALRSQLDSMIHRYMYRPIEKRGPEREAIIAIARAIPTARLSVDDVVSMSLDEIVESVQSGVRRQ